MKTLKDVVEMNNLFFTKDGAVKSLVRVSPYVNANGDSFVKLHRGKYTEKRLVSRLVAEAFVPNPNNYKYVRHINGIKTDNRAVNLEWVETPEK